MLRDHDGIVTYLDSRRLHPIMILHSISIVATATRMACAIASTLSPLSDSMGSQNEITSAACTVMFLSHRGLAYTKILSSSIRDPKGGTQKFRRSLHAYVSIYLRAYYWGFRMQCCADLTQTYCNSFHFLLHYPYMTLCYLMLSEYYLGLLYAQTEEGFRPPALLLPRPLACWSPRHRVSGARLMRVS